VSDPHAEYSKRLANYETLAASKNRLHVRIGNTKLVVIAAGLLLTYLSLAKPLLSPTWLLLPIALYLILAAIHEQILRAHHRAQTAASYYKRGIARIDDRWLGTGPTGERFRDENHVYADDLDLFGRGSLFELLSTARLPMGESRLAQWLLSPSRMPEILERQALVVELRPKIDLHENIALTGEDLRARLNPESLIGWAESPRALPGSAIRAVAVALAAAFIAAIGYWFYSEQYAPLLVVLIVQILFRRWLLRRAEVILSGISCNAEGLILFAQILHRLERQPFAAPRLQNFATELQRAGAPASRAIRQLARTVYWIDAHHSLLAHIAELPLLYTLQVAFAAEAWRHRHGARMRTWINIAAEMEALLSLATYSFEHPADPFAQLVDAQLVVDNPLSSSGSAPAPGVEVAPGAPDPSGAQTRAYFAGEELGHPLLPAAKCIRNSVVLDHSTRVILISGSNMSGKSTLLRTVGINTVLAMAGAPVRAKSLRLSPLTIGTRIRSTDSLQEGRSTFYTEILHIRRVFDLANSHSAGNGRTATPPLLFLFDELLEGTNSHDRRIGAESLLRGLLQRGAIGIVTTHDLALTEVTSGIGPVLRNKHFEDQVANNEMHFDYKLRDGVVTKSNALALMRIIGLET
jgi:MutS domain V